MSCRSWQNASIRAARVEEADAVFQLLHEVFAGTVLPYTIYQSGASLRYLEALIGKQSPSEPRIVVCVGDGKVAGFYEGVRHDNAHFLNYIGVSATAQGCGLGDRLLAHFEAEGAKRGCPALSLDVFKSNHRARQWYHRHGYRREKTFFTTRVALSAIITDGAVRLECNDEDIELALREEQNQGFSTIKCSCGAGRVTVGWIAGRICKLLDREDVSLEDAIPSIAARFAPQRETLVVASDSLLGPAWSTVAVEEVERLTRSTGTGA